MVVDQEGVDAEVDCEPPTHVQQIARPLAESPVVPHTLEGELAIEEPGSGRCAEESKQTGNSRIGKQDGNQELHDPCINQVAEESANSKEDDLSHAPPRGLGACKSQESHRLCRPTLSKSTQSQHRRKL